MPRPDWRLQYGFILASLAILTFDLPHFCARTTEVHLRPHARRPRCAETLERLHERQAFRVEAPVVLVVPDALHARCFMHLQDIACGKTDVVVFQNQSAA